MDGFVETATRLTIVNPIAEPHARVDESNRAKPAPRPATLEGKTVALYWNGKQNGLDALAQARKNLSALYPNIRFIEMIGELGGTNRYLSPEQLLKLQAEADAAVCTSADCGSCTS